MFSRHSQSKDWPIHGRSDADFFDLQLSATDSLQQAHLTSWRCRPNTFLVFLVFVVSQWSMSLSKQHFRFRSARNITASDFWLCQTDGVLFRLSVVINRLFSILSAYDSQRTRRKRSLIGRTNQYTRMYGQRREKVTQMMSRLICSMCSNAIL